MGTFVIFVVILLVVLWLFEIVFLGSFYEHMKKNTLQSVTNSIMMNMNHENIGEYIEEISQQNELCIAYVTSNTSAVSFDNLQGCKINSLKSEPQQLEKYIRLALANQGHYLVEIENYSPQKINVWDYLVFTSEEINLGKELIDITATTDPISGISTILLVNARITPVNATVSTLKAQLFVFSFIAVLLGLVMAWILSKRVSEPIITINQDAKNLIQGKYNTKLKGMTYQEIEQLNDTLTYANEEINKAESFKRELIANVSHDLRTPLTMITGYSEVMRDIPNENTAENIQIIIDESKRLTSLVNDLLNLSKYQSNEMKMELKCTNITECIQNTLLRYNKLVEQEGLKIIFDYHENIWCMMDEGKILQVLYNLINNAINYTGEDKTVVINQIIKGDVVRIEVCDFGEGISEEEKEYIWDRYYKSKKNHQRATVGSGIGLSIVKSVCLMHKASYGVDSKLHEGSVFWFEMKIDHIEK